MLLTCQSVMRDVVLEILGHVPPSSPDYSLFTASLLAALFGAAVALQVARIPANLRRYDPDEYAPDWRGLRGALVLLVAFALLEPIRLGIGIRCREFMYYHETMQVLVSPRSPLGSPWGGWLIWYQAIAFPAQLGFALGMLVPMFRRRRSFRAMAIWYLVVNLLVLAGNDILVMQAFSGYPEVPHENFRMMSTSLSAAFPMAAYLFASRRVHATFHR